MLLVRQYTSDILCFFSLFTAKNIIQSRVNILFGSKASDVKEICRSTQPSLKSPVHKSPKSPYFKKLNLAR
jgi:hypothetical protein